MTLSHRFYLIPEGSIAYDHYNIFLGRKQPRTHPSTVLDDMTLAYLARSLEWVASINPQNFENWRGYGLSMYGATIINKTGGATLNGIMTSWAMLFSYAPQVIKLYTYQEVSYNENQQEIFTAKDAEVDRDSFITALRKLADFGEKTASGEFFILHIGL